MSTKKRSLAAEKTQPGLHMSPRTLVVMATFLALFAVLYIVLPAIGKFGNTYALLRHAHITDLFLALISILGTYVAAACAYQFLALHPIRYARTLLMQVASGFANRILPAGSGGLALNVQYLRKSRHSTAEAGVVVAANNGLGFVANVLLLTIFIVLNHGRDIHVGVSMQAFDHVALYILLGTVMAIVGHMYVRRFINLDRYIRPLTKSLGFYKRQPHRLVLGLLSSLGVCLLYTSVLFWAAHGLDVQLTFAQALFAMTLSTAGTILIPTPGGIGGAEAGVVSALLAVHVSSPLSLAVALLYRVFTFWLPVAMGALAFRFSLRYLS